MLNIFELAENKVLSQKESFNLLNLSNSKNDLESFDKEKIILVCGNTECGKSISISRFLNNRSYLVNGITASSANNSNKPTKTMAFEFSYITKNFDFNKKEVTYIWELSGDGLLASLLNILLTPESINYFSVILFLDLNRPEKFRSILEPFFTTLRKRINEIFEILKICKSNEYVENLIHSLKKRYGNIEKTNIIQPFEIPVTIIGANYDTFQNEDSEKKRNILKILRYFACINGASLMFYSNYIEKLVAHLNSLFAHYALGNSFNHKIFATDIHEPVFICSGTDTLENIELIKIINFSSNYEAMEEGFRILDEYFPQIIENLKNDLKTNSFIHLLDDKQFAEPMIDRLIEFKALALDMFIKSKRDRNIAEENAKQRDSQF